MLIPLMQLLLFLLPLLLGVSLHGLEEDHQMELFHDLETLDCIQRKNCDEMPVTYNYLLGGGYFNMPSARMGKEGELAGGFAYVPPYRHYNLRLQLFDRVEIYGNYRVFSGVEDPVLSPFGFGDKSDKGVNIKLALVKPEDSHYALPGFAIGFEDFLGTKSFEAKYIVASYVLLNYDLEMSLGYGRRRINGVFGGVTWMPYRTSQGWLKGLALCAEYDATDYHHHEPHPQGRKCDSHINFGVKYRFLDHVDFTTSYMKGRNVACAISIFENFGQCGGFFPKVDDPKPYLGPVNLEPTGPLRPAKTLACDLLYPFDAQGFDLLEAWISSDQNCQKVLRLKVYNRSYWRESEVRLRITHLLSALIPSDISHVIVMMEGEGYAIQEYHFPMEFVRRYHEKTLCPYELELLSPLRDVPASPSCVEQCLFWTHRPILCWDLWPRIEMFFGSAKGKFKYALGVDFSISGFIPDDVYYSVAVGYIPITKLEKIGDVDKLNPSQLINVRTDTIRYLQKRGFVVDEAYLQKSWNYGRGFYFRGAAGLFELAYGGLAGEFLYYPVASNWAWGLEGAWLLKRTYSGIGFKHSIRKLDGFKPTQHRFHGAQYFLSLYHTSEPLKMDFHWMAGKFLAQDWGIRTEVSHYFSSGMRVYTWFTYTDGKDRVNGHRYHDYGLAISMPLDIFSTCSSRKEWSYGMSAWLRDVGAVSATGIPLYPILREQRQRGG